MRGGQQVVSSPKSATHDEDGPLLSRTGPSFAHLGGAVEALIGELAETVPYANTELQLKVGSRVSLS